MDGIPGILLIASSDLPSSISKQISSANLGVSLRLRGGIFPPCIISLLAMARFLSVFYDQNHAVLVPENCKTRPKLMQNTLISGVFPR
jgi:hypothetical protein